MIVPAFYRSCLTADALSLVKGYFPLSFCLPQRGLFVGEKLGIVALFTLECPPSALLRAFSDWGS